MIGCFSRGDDVAVIKKAVMAAYPFGERKYWPHHVWRDEVARQLGLRQGRMRFRARQSPDARQTVLPF